MRRFRPYRVIYDDGQPTLHFQRITRYDSSNAAVTDRLLQCAGRFLNKAALRSWLARAPNPAALMDTLCTLGEVRRKRCDVWRDSVVVRCVAREHRARAHADSARRHQYLLPSSDATTFAMARHVGRRHELLTVGDEPEHVMLRYPAHARPIQVVTVEVLIDIEGDVAMLDLFKHMPLEEMPTACVV